MKTIKECDKTSNLNVNLISVVNLSNVKEYFLALKSNLLFVIDFYDFTYSFIVIFSVLLICNSASSIYFEFIIFSLIHKLF